MKKIGLLGGIGPEATGSFYLNLIAEFQKRKLIKSNVDFPQIFINSIPAPELVYEKISTEDLQPYARGLRALECCDVDFIAMICNTIHAFYGELQKEVQTPIIDLREEVHRSLSRKRPKKVLVLGTPSTIEKGLYHFKGITYEPLDKEEILKLGEAVFNFNKNFQKKKQARDVLRITKNHLKNDVRLVVLGCTEIALMLKNEKIPTIDPMDILADAVVNRALRSH